MDGVCPCGGMRVIRPRRIKVIC
ncbi:hypothetical protein [Brevibacillus brevis]